MKENLRTITIEFKQTKNENQNFCNNSTHRSIYFNKDYSIPKFSSLALKTEDLDNYLGVYSSTQIPIRITITKDNATLIAQATGQSSFALEATEKDNFKFDPAGVKIEFNTANNEMTLRQGGGNFLFTKDK